MKKFVKIFFVLSLVIFTTNSFAQDKNNPWQFSFGLSALNFNGTNESGEGLFDEYFGLEEHWNVQSSISTVSLSRYAGNGFSVGFRASINNFTKLSDGFGKYPENRVSPMNMKSFDILVTKDLSKYSFYNFEPYVEIGAGQTHVENQQDNHVNLGVGVHYPISEKVSLKINTVYRKNFKNDGLVDYASKIHPHFQHSVGLSINFGGKDSDQDGVYDQHDDCPKIPGLPAFNGCPDSDGDGIEDSKDACPEVPGLLEFNGCADSDGDGVADPNDKCPSVAGLSKFDGCPDSDGDGIEDSKDECPNAAGPAGYGGCPDTDGDGVSDQNDKCPEIAGPADNNGCPNPTAEAIEKLNALGAVVQFELNKSNIKSEALDLLLAVYEIMKNISGTGKDGRISKADIKNYLENSTKKSKGNIEKNIEKVDNFSGRDEERVPMSRMRSTIAKRLLSVTQETAMLTTFNEVDMKPIKDLKEKYGTEFLSEHGLKLGFMGFFVAASINALKKFPVANASIDGNDVVYHGYQDISVAVSTDRGLVVPVIRDADIMTLPDIEKSILEYSEKAKEGKLTIEDMQGGTFTISNGGVFGSLLSTPILNAPQTAILGMHTIQDRAVVIDGKIEVRPMMYLALSYDHRLLDGKDAVGFLICIKEQLEAPQRLLLNL